MALNQARNGLKKCLAVAFNRLTLCLFFVRSFYILGRNIQINRMVPCVFRLLSFHFTFHNSYAYFGGVCSFSLQFIYLYSIDREYKFIIKRQILRAQPLGWRTTLEDANFLIHIVLAELLLFPGVCGSVWTDSQLILVLFHFLPGKAFEECIYFKFILVQFAFFDLKFLISLFSVKQKQSINICDLHKRIKSFDQNNQLQNNNFINDRIQCTKLA